jgi:hypothetical protein
MEYEYQHPDGSTRYYKSPDPEAGRWVVFYKHPNARLWLYMETVTNKQQHQIKMAEQYPARPDFYYTQLRIKENQ